MAARELAELAEEQRAHFMRIRSLIQGHGLERVHHPHADHIEGGLWEMRLKGPSGIARALYVTRHPQRVVVVRVFVKKTQKTPRRENQTGPGAGRGDRMKKKLVSADELHAKWMKEPTYRKAYDDLEDEFRLASVMTEARARAGLTQEELAARMKTKQTVIARLESGRAKPSTRTLERIAQATGHRLKISFEPLPAR